MSFVDQVDRFEIDNVVADTHMDSGMDPGGSVWTDIEGPDWSLRRVWWWDSYSKGHARNFVRKIAQDHDYLYRCLGRKTTWARLSDYYQEHNEAIYFILDGYPEIPPGELSRAHESVSKPLYDELKSLFESGDPDEDDLQEVVDCHIEKTEVARDDLLEKWRAARTDHVLTFGKYEGKTLLEVAKEDLGYAEWAAKKLSNRPAVQKGFKNAITQARLK